MKRKKLNVFSLSFLDIITCGLGAIILLFVLINARSSAQRDTIITDLRAETKLIKQKVLQGKKDLVLARNALEKKLEELVRTEGQTLQIIETIQNQKVELSDSDKETLAFKAHVKKLKSDLKSLEEDAKRLRAGAKAAEELGTKQRPFPGHGDRQYLTDLKMGGRRIFILVDSSASMLDELIINIIRRRNLPAKQKLKSAKWQQAVSTIDWLTTQISPISKFQIYKFNETAKPLIAGTHGKWLDASDVDKLDEAVSRMRKLIPQKGTSLLNAFNAIKAMDPPPDNIFLLTDGLPTMGSKKPWGKRVSGKKRLSLFHEAIRTLSPGVPVNIIMYPMEGDPYAPTAFWRLAKATRGSFFCPSEDWP